MMSSSTPEPRTLGQLKASGYALKSIREEMRANLIAAMRKGDRLFPGIVAPWRSGLRGYARHARK